MKILVKLYIFTLLSIAAHSCCNAQYFNYFNKIYETDSSKLIISIVEPLEDDKFMLIGSEGSNLNLYIYIYITDQYGNITIKNLIEKGVQFGLGYFETDLKKTIDGDYVLFYTHIKEGFDTDVRIVKFNQDTIFWKKTVGNPLAREVCYDMVETNDGGYILSGWQQYPEYGDPVDFYALKINAEGEKVWDKTYRFDGYESRGLGIARTDDNHYILSGRGRYTLGSDLDLALIKIDSIGNLIDVKTWGSDNDDCLAFIEKKNTNEFLISYCTDTDYKKINMRIVDADLNLLKEKNFTLPDNLTSNGNSFNLFPKINNQNEIYACLFYFNDLYRRQSLIAKFNQNLEIEWLKPYTINEDKRIYLVDSEFTPDNGIVYAGFQLDQPQKGWLLKIDRDGNTCSGINCDSTALRFTVDSLDLDVEIGFMDSLPINTDTIIIENPDTSSPIVKIPMDTISSIQNHLQFADIDITISPNPTSGMVQINYQLPNNIKEATLYFFNSNGQIVDTRVLLPFHNSLNLNFHKAPIGIYLWKLVVNGKKLKDGKLIIR